MISEGMTMYLRKVAGIVAVPSLEAGMTPVKGQVNNDDTEIAKIAMILLIDFNILTRYYNEYSQNGRH
jgi:hypothetical protein